MQFQVPCCPTRAARSCDPGTREANCRTPKSPNFNQLGCNDWRSHHADRRAARELQRAGDSRSPCPGRGQGDPARAADRTNPDFVAIVLALSNRRHRGGRRLPQATSAPSRLTLRRALSHHRPRQGSWLCDFGGPDRVARPTNGGQGGRSDVGSQPRTFHPSKN